MTRNVAAEVRLSDIAQLAASKHYASVKDPKAIGALVLVIDDCEGSIVTRYALQLSALTFVRPGELRHAEWSEFDLQAAEWRIPAKKQTAHGFRSMASTRLHELGFPHLVIERQLAHAGRNAVTAAYNFAEYLPKRPRMMQAWGDHLDDLKGGATVPPFRRPAQAFSWR